MRPDVHLRPATANDAASLSSLIQATIKISNARDYSPEVIERVAANFSQTTLRALIEKRQILIALRGDTAVGTASLDHDVVRTVFVHPDEQGQGIGQSLMVQIEDLARASGVQSLRVPASLTAEYFYTRLGYSFVKEVFDGDERTIVLEKVI
ncbi:GNAT family N-acetyltransferase [Acidimangrovimonas sediminis]|uniref:GNAT family N-acetyltransferase n=1 Tax=Acidimangrovimonas sediminis TaxID=2056283 RepID=UPI000C8044B0|nr:GNAT family N-acetyltransferase [Acidimangrovimonas sediminis]